MVKSAFRSLTSFLDIHGVRVPYESYGSNIKGSFGKRNRNNCQHVTWSSSPGHITYVDPDYNVFLTTGLTRFNAETVQMVYAMYEERIDREVYAYMNTVAKRLYPIDLSFNLVNFFIELRDLPSLADPLKAVNRNLKKLKKDARSAPLGANGSPKIRRPSRSEVNSALDDVSQSYVGGQFGLVPTISDAGEIHSRFNEMQSNHSRLVQTLKKSPRFRKRIQVALPPLSLRLPQELNLTPTALVQSQKSKVLVRVKSCTVVVSGRVKYACPDLYTLGPLLAALDVGGLKFSLSTLWNATPFSWLVDWVLPIGDALAAMDKPFLDISTRIDGQYSVKLRLAFTFIPDGIDSYSGLRQMRSGGVADATLYNRFALPSDLMAFRPPPMPSFKGIWGPKKFGILAGIAKGFLGKL